MSDGKVEKSITEAKALSGKPAATVKLSSVDMTVDIYRCKVRQIGEVLDFISFAFDALGINKLSDLYKMQGEELVATELAKTLDDTQLILQLIAKSMDRVFGMASSLSSVPVNDFYELELDDALQILLKVWEVNRDFFLQRILPTLKSQFA